MDLGKELQDIGAQLGTWHAKTGTSLELSVYLQDGEVRYRVWLASSDIGAFDFANATLVTDWLTLVNNDIEPHSAAVRLIQAEQLRVQQIELEAKAAVIAKEIEDLPETQRILLAKAEALARTEEANNKLAELEKQRLAAEAEAAVKEEELAEKEAAAEAIDAVDPGKEQELVDVVETEKAQR